MLSVMNREKYKIRQKMEIVRCLPKLCNILRERERERERGRESTMREGG